MTGADDTKLEDFGFKENDKCIVIGQKVKGALKVGQFYKINLEIK